MARSPPSSLQFYLSPYLLVSKPPQPPLYQPRSSPLFLYSCSPAAVTLRSPFRGLRYTSRSSLLANHISRRYTLDLGRPRHRAIVPSPFPPPGPGFARCCVRRRSSSNLASSCGLNHLCCLCSLISSIPRRATAPLKPPPASSQASPPEPQFAQFEAASR